MTDIRTCEACGNNFPRPFRKGLPKLVSITQWRKAKYCSRECMVKSPAYKERMREIALAKGYGKWMTGKQASDEARAKISLGNMGQKKRLGHTPSIETRKLLSDALKGEKSHLWRGGRTNSGTLIRSSMEYRAWRKSVFQRDGYACVVCGDHGVKFHADHIKSFALFPELRFDVDNGRTLCVPCHKDTPTYLKSGRQLVEAQFPGVKIIEV